MLTPKPIMYCSQLGFEKQYITFCPVQNSSDSWHSLNFFIFFFCSAAVYCNSQGGWFCGVHYPACLLKGPWPHSHCTSAQAPWLFEKLFIAGNLNDLLAHLSGALGQGSTPSVSIHQQRMSKNRARKVTKTAQDFCPHVQ